jgi:16S rRNA (guanine966-N2)-methyltransferase
LGLEALSRGAAHCLFVENDGAALDTIRANIASLRARERATVQAGSVMSLAPAKQSHDLILLDPPYGTGAGQVALDRMLRLGWIGEATWIALETAKDEDVAIKRLTVDAERKVGKAKLTLLRLET